MPGTGPEMSETFAIVIVLSVMPVWFLKPSQLPALALPAAALSPVAAGASAGAPPVEPLPVLPDPVDPDDEPVPPSAVRPEPPSEPAAAVPPAPPVVVPLTWATVSGSSCEPQAARVLTPRSTAAASSGPVLRMG